MYILLKDDVYIFIVLSITKKNEMRDVRVSQIIFISHAWSAKMSQGNVVRLYKRKAKELVKKKFPWIWTNSFAGMSDRVSIICILGNLFALLTTKYFLNVLYN